MLEIGRGPLTFGQMSLWRHIEHWPADRKWNANSRATWELPDGATVESVRAALAAMVERHEGLRTGYVTDAAGGVEQVVWRRPEDLPVGVVEATREQAADITVALTREAFALDRELPWRARILTDGGRPVSLALAIHHIAADGWALSLLHDELLDRLAGRTPPPLGMSPRDVAAQQRSDGWAARRASATGYWRDVLTSAGPLLVDPREAMTGPRNTWMVRLTSPALTRDAGALATRLKVTVHAVMLAAFSLSVARRTGEEAVVVLLMSGNRAERAWRSVVSSFNQGVPLIVRVEPGDDLATLTRRVHRESLTAYWNGCVDPETRTGPIRNGSTEPFRYCFNMVGARAAAEPVRGEVAPDRVTVTGTSGVGYPLYFVAGAASPDDYVLQQVSDDADGDATVAHLESIRALIADQLPALSPDGPP